jgi:hypothetical protein
MRLGWPAELERSKKLIGLRQLLADGNGEDGGDGGG